MLLEDTANTMRDLSNNVELEQVAGGTSRSPKDSIQQYTSGDSLLEYVDSRMCDCSSDIGHDPVLSELTTQTNTTSFASCIFEQAARVPCIASHLKRSSEIWWEAAA